MTKSELRPEYEILHGGCGLLDRSERGKLALTGSEAKSFLHGQVTNDVEGLAPGRGCYAAFLTPKGKMQGDLRILDTGVELWLDTERLALQPLFTTIARYKLGADVELHKRTLERGLLSLIGPKAREVAGAADLPQEEHANARGEVEGIPVMLVATEIGVDLVCDAARTEELAVALRARGATDVGEAAAEALRVEHGRPRFGIDLDETVIPEEAGLNDRAVSFTKGCYVGQETVARLHYRGKPNRHLRTLRLDGPAATGDELRLGEKPVGRLGSVVDHPELGPIALAIVRREAAPGDTLAVAGGDTTAVVVERAGEPAHDDDPGG
jgi:folate-binding protein YgfZ